MENKAVPQETLQKLNKFYKDQMGKMVAVPALCLVMMEFSLYTSGSVIGFILANILLLALIGYLFFLVRKIKPSLIETIGIDGYFQRLKKYRKGLSIKRDLGIVLCSVLTIVFILVVRREDFRWYEYIILSIIPICLLFGFWSTTLSFSKNGIKQIDEIITEMEEN